MVLLNASSPQTASQMAAQGFWLFYGLKEEPYGMLPLVNLTSKGGPTTIKGCERVGSYSWYLEDQTATVVIPGSPLEYKFWAGGRLQPDKGVLIYDANHMKVSDGPLDPLILVAKWAAEKKKQSINFQDFDIVTDAINLQKLFAFCKGEGEGLFRIDCERVGKTVYLSRMEACDLIEVDYESFDQSLKGKVSKPRSKLTEGPFNSINKYQFGNFKMLVRSEIDLGDYASIGEASPDDKDSGTANGTAAELPKKQFEQNGQIAYIEGGDVKKTLPLMTLTAFPQSRGFPFFTWAQLFFSGADATVVGWWRGTNDFTRPANYALSDINKLMKPLPYAILSKVHDCLAKITTFVQSNSEELKISLLWKGSEFLEIYEKVPECPGAVSDGVKDYLKGQVAGE